MVKYRRIKPHIKLIALTAIISSLFSIGCKEEKVDFNQEARKAMLLEKEGQHSAALMVINKVIKDSPANELFYLLRGKVLMSLEKDSAAISDFTKSIQLNPKSTAGYYYRGVSNFLIDSNVKAIDDFNRSLVSKKNGNTTIELNPEMLSDLERQFQLSNAQIVFYRGKAKYYSNDLQGALHDFQQALAFRFEISECKLYIATIQLAIGDIKVGCQILASEELLSNRKAQDLYIKYCK